MIAKGRIKFQDILGKNGKKYDDYFSKSPEKYYLTYNCNYYSDRFKFSIEREGFGTSEPVMLSNNIKQITYLIDKLLSKEKNKSYER